MQVLQAWMRWPPSRDQRMPLRPMRSKLAPVKKVARMLKSHLDQFLSFFMGADLLSPLKSIM